MIIVEQGNLQYVDSVKLGIILLVITVMTVNIISPIIKYQLVIITISLKFRLILQRKAQLLKQFAVDYLKVLLWLILELILNAVGLMQKEF